MEDKTTFSEKIAAWFGGRMTPSERLLFEAERLQNPALEEACQTFRLMQQSILTQKKQAFLQMLNSEPAAETSALSDDNVRDYAIGRLKDYLKAAAIERQMAEDPAFRQEVQFQKLMAKGLLETKKKAFIGELFPADEGSLAEHPTNPQAATAAALTPLGAYSGGGLNPAATGGRIVSMSARQRRVLSLAAAIALLVVATWGGWRMSYLSGVKDLGHTQAMPHVAPDAWKGDMPGATLHVGDTAQILFNVAFADYQQKKYSKAEAGFQRLTDAFPDSHLTASAKFYLSSCLLLQQKSPGKALSYLQELVSEGQIGAVSRETVQWNLGLAYMQNGDPESAKQIFTALKNGKTEYSSKAGEMLEKF